MRYCVFGGSSMSYMLDNMTEMNDLLDKCNHFVIVGTGWIGKLIYYWLVQNNISIERLEIAKIEEKLESKWTVSIIKNIDEILGEDDKCIIVAKKEEEGKRYASELEKIINNNVLFLSERLKNELDKNFMCVNPALYEKEVLISRKEELDNEMDKNVKDAICQIYAKQEFPIFQTIEIETVNRCNGTCQFCPINCLDDTRIYKKMSNELFEKIIKELSELKYEGRINLFSNNEPLIDDRIVDFAEYTAKKLPLAQKILFTNGTLLNIERFEKLVNNLDLMCIDIYYDNEVLSELSNDLIQILKLGIDNFEIQKKVMVQFICRSAIRNNRGGQSKNRNISYYVQAGCLLPYIQMVIRPDGKISLCCNDPLGKNTLGDVSKNTLLEIWNSSKYKNIRKNIGTTRQNFEFCKKCDNYASLNIHGKAVFTDEQRRDAWKQVNSYITGDK